MVRSVVFAQVKKMFSKNAGFDAVFARIEIKFLKDRFDAKTENITRTKVATDTRKISESSDLSDVLIERIKKKAQFKELHVAILKIDFEKKTVDTNIYFIDMEGNHAHKKIEDLF